MLEILLMLDCKYGRTIQEISDRFGVSQRTVYRYFDTFKQVVFVIENNKGITAFTGQLIFTDLFDKEIKSLNLTYDDGVAADSIKNYSATTDYNQFMDEDQLLKSKSLKQIKLVWKPEKILFADGTTLE